MSTAAAIDPARHPKLAGLLTLQFERTPTYRTSLETRLAGEDERGLELLEELAGQIVALAGDRLPQFCDSYDFICQIMRKEEIHFMRTGEYRLKTFAEADRLVYADHEYMSRYMSGLLMSQVYWSNHSASHRFYFDFLADAPEGYDYLEIGPGHGLLLYRAISDLRCGSVSGWDLSPASVDATRAALKALGARGHEPDLRLQDLNAAKGEDKRFDAVTFSEVLEHLEDPAGGLARLYDILKPGGRVFFNVPVNSPAPDHIFLLRSPEEVVEFIRAAGFEIERAEFYPLTNRTLEQARKHSLTISTCVVARRPA